MYGRYTSAPSSNRKDWRNIRKMLPYVWEYKGRVVFALLALVLSKIAIVAIPLLLKEIVDTLDQDPSQLLVFPLMLFLIYGALRLANSLFNELRDAIFARVRFHAMRRLSQKVLDHLHSLSLRFHLDRKTGDITRDMDRGTGSISSIMKYLVFNIIPTMAEFILVAVILLSQYESKFALITFITVAIYITFTFMISNWRMHYRHEMNSLDSTANGQAVDSLLNYETVKYFNNEQHELNRYDQTLGKWEDVAVKSQSSMSLLNFGQAGIIACGLTVIMIYAGQGVMQGTMSLGDLVLVNTMMLQLFIPLNFLGIIYRMLRHTLADMEMILNLLEAKPEIEDAVDATSLHVSEGEVRFENIGFSYNDDREILKNISFTIPAGSKLGVVGASGAGKSTLSRLLFRFYDPQAGQIRIDGQDISQVSQQSLRQQIGMVPQDTVLFNDTIYYNIQYASAAASRDDVINAAKMANLDTFIQSLPDGYDTLVGERGLKLSGGEKQRVAIARVILKNAPILIFDEATSSLDSKSEKTILASLKEISQHHTTLVIAHRLSTIIDASHIIVVYKGEIVESGTHQSLLDAGGIYTSMWQLQQEQRATPPFIEQEAV